MRIRLPTGLLRAVVGVVGRTIVSPRTPIAVQRRVMNAVSAAERPPRGTRVAGAVVGGVSGEWVRPPGTRGGVLLFLHGGGYAFGSARSYRALAGRMAARMGLAAFVPDYRLAPEHPHPAALEDALAAYRGLLAEGVAPERIAVAGDSAGGGLALALAMALRDAGLPAPAAVGMMCPWLDLAADLDGGRPPAPREPILTPAASARWAAAYVGGHDPADPAISPLFGELSGLPPLVLHYAGDDLLAADGERLVEAAQAAGAELEHHRFAGLWHDFHIHAEVLAAADDAVAGMADALGARLAPAARSPRVGIVGAGMSGLCMAAKLREAGIDDFAIYEKADTLGGTWRENRYPGLTCDVPSRFYSYSFAPNPGWTHAYSPGAEIQEYFVGIADELGLEPFIRYGSEVTDARWEGGRWHLRTRDGHEDSVDVLVSAAGVLHHPRLPEIEGLETFEGAVFHSSRWDHSVPLDGKRVGVIGTGSTGTQITAALAGEVDRFLLFQRTAQWVLPVGNRRYTRLSRTLLRRIPALTRAGYRVNQMALEMLLGVAVTRDGWQRKLLGAACRLSLRFGVRDPDLRRRLTPDYEPMCKRLVMSGDFYRAIQRPGAELVSEQIERVEPRGVVTRDGALHEVDVLVLATGFDAHAYMRPMDLVGEDGVTLEEAWADGPRAYRTVAMPGFPNFFMLMGPHSPIGNQSLIAVAEAQVDYVMSWVERLSQGKITSASPTAAATARYNEELRRAIPGTVFATGCVSWYLDKDGLPELWPWTPRRHRAMLREPVLEDFTLTRDGVGSPAPEPSRAA